MTTTITLLWVILAFIGVLISLFTFFYKRKYNYKKLKTYRGFDFEGNKKFLINPEPTTAKYNMNDLIYLGTHKPENYYWQTTIKDCVKKRFEEDYKYGYYVFLYREVVRLYIPKTWALKDKELPKFVKNLIDIDFDKKHEWHVI